MNISQKLRQIEALTVPDGLIFQEHRAIDIWTRLAGPQYDCTVLSSSSRGRIALIHHLYFEHVPGSDGVYVRRAVE